MYLTVLKVRWSVESQNGEPVGSGSGAGQLRGMGKIRVSRTRRHTPRSAGHHLAAAIGFAEWEGQGGCGVMHLQVLNSGCRQFDLAEHPPYPDDQDICSMGHATGVERLDVSGANQGPQGRQGGKLPSSGWGLGLSQCCASCP